MNKRDPYSILGVSRSASDEEIKSAYRRLARIHHPDMNNNSKDSEVRFKELSEAYEILADKQKRRNFDRFGYEGVDPNFRGFGSASAQNPFGEAGFGRSAFRFNFGDYSRNSSYGVFEDIFSDFFGMSGQRRHRRPEPRRGDDLGYDLTIDFDQAYHGVSAVVRILGRSISVHIPAGVDTDSRIRVPGQGAPGSYGGPPGDLYLNISVTPHRLFRRDGNDIHLVVPITVGEAILGAKVEVPGPDGRLMLKISPGTQSGTSFRFKGKGFPSLKGGTRGDFYVTTRIVIPEKIDPVSRDLLAEFDRLNPINPREGL